jgi:hypothetical protein
MEEEQIDRDRSDDTTRQRARAALDRHDDLRSRSVARLPRKPENTAAGCREMAENDRARAKADGNDSMKMVLERSANAWEARGVIFKRLETQRERQNNG